MALRGCRVTSYNGRCLNASDDPSDIVLSPKHERAIKVRDWYRSHANHSEVLEKVIQLTVPAAVDNFVTLSEMQKQVHDVFIDKVQT